MEKVIPGNAAGPNKTRWALADPSYLVLALLPWLLLAVDSRWIYNPLRSIDPWVYLGYFLNYPRYVGGWFPDIYYGSRLSWILPGYYLHSLFDPMPARYILHVGFYYLAIFSLYILLRKAAGPRTALLVAVLFGTHSYFLRAIGWDYVDGAGITYNLLALVCVAQAAPSRSRPWLVASGAAAAAMFYCNAFLVVFLPFLPVFYLYQVHKGFSWRSVRMALSFFLWFAGGALLVTVIFGIVNHKAGAGFWFYEPSLQFIRDKSSQPSRPPVLWSSWTGNGNWLGLPLMAALGSLSYLLIGFRRQAFAKRDLRLFFVLQYLGCFAIMVAWQLAGGIGLETYYYTSYLIPSAFLAIGCLFTLRLERWPTPAYWLLLAVVMLAFIASLRLDGTRIAVQIYHLGWISLTVSVGLCLMLNLFARNRWQILLLILCGLWLFQTARPLAYAKEDQQAAVNSARITESAKLVGKHTGEDALGFWYNVSEPSGPEFHAVNSIYLWSYAMVGRDFPAPLQEFPVQPGTEGVILSSHDDALQQANQALAARHLLVRPLGTEKIDRAGVNYSLLFFRAEPLGMDPEVPLKLSAEPAQSKQLLLAQAANAVPFPREQWAFCDYLPDGGMQLSPAGVQVTTHRVRYSYAVRYPPVTAAKPGTYRFVLEYENLHGGLEFGLLSGDESHWLILPRQAQKNGGNGTRVLYASLSAGEQAVPMVCNFAVQKQDRTSTFMIKSLRAFGAFNK